MSIKTDHETALERLRLNAELTARDDALLRFVDSEKQLRAELFSARDELKAIAEVLPKTGHDTLGAARDVMQSLSELRVALSTARALLLKLRPLTLQVCRSRGGNSLEATHLTHEIDAVKEDKA
jgi:hypothetical protein